MTSERIRRQVDRLLDEAEAASARRDWIVVRDLAAHALTFDPENADAAALLIVAERGLSAATPSPDAPASSSAPDSKLQTPSPLPPPLPAAFASGRYEVRSFLGEGGRKRVYLAHDTRLGRDVALAVIKTDGLDLLGLQRVRNEAQSMARLGDYPNVVTVFDVMEEDGAPLLVSQYMAGGSVEDLIAGAEDHRLPLEDAVRVASQVCQGLEQAHRRGIVHRDLKPGNIWLTEDGVACVGDFGLAVALDRSRLTAEGSFVGTALYMAPEQALGQTPEARSDLYSLGCVLYEMVTGRPPFVGDDTVAVVTQHLNTPPVAPTWHRPDCPAGLEALVLRLLEKDPSKRPESAAEVTQLLAAVDLKSPAPNSIIQSPASGPDPLYRQTFVGREAELRQLQSAFDQALSGQGGLVMVVGEPGIGKTALTEQLATYVAMRGGRALHGNCYEEGSLSLPYLPFIEAMRTYVMSREPDALRSELGSNAGYVARIVSEVRDRIEVELPPAGDPEDERWRLLQAVTVFLRNASTVQPLAIVIEDLHWSDKGTLDLLQHLARNLQGARLLVIGTYRDVEVDRTHPLSGALAELRRVGSFSRVTLRGLGLVDVHKMLSQIAGREVQRATAEQVHRQTEGNPLFVQEVVRYLVEEGLIGRDAGPGGRAGDGSTPLAMQIPEGLRDVIGKRISRLSPDCNRVLSVAAVIGREFTLGTLGRVVGTEPDTLAASLDEAVKVGVLEERSQVGGVNYRFAHAFFRQTLYEELGAARRLRLHQQVGRTLETLYAARVGEHATELAEHFSNSTDAEDLAKAVAYGEAAARRARSVFDYGEAVRLLERALDVQEVLDPDDKAKRCDLLLVLGDALMPAGQPLKAAEEVAEEAFALAEALVDDDRAALACRVATDGLFRYGGPNFMGAAVHRKWARRFDLKARPGTVHRVYADIRAAAVLFDGEDEWERGWEALERARANAERLGDQEAFFLALNFQIGAPFTARRQEAKLRLVEEYVTGRPTIASRLYTWALGGAQINYVSWGDREKAEACTRLQRLESDRSRDPSSLRGTTIAERRLDFVDGQFEDVLAFAAGVEDEAAARGSPVMGATLSGVAVRPLLHLGRAAEALELASMRRAGLRDDVRTRSVQALCQASVGLMEDAALTLEEIVRKEESSAGHLRDLPFTAALALLETAVLVEDREAATMLTAELACLADMAYGATAGVSPGRILGQAAKLLGQPDEALAYYLKALTATETLRFRPEIALIRFQIAQLLLDHYSDERSEALNHLEFALAEFREMKMAPYVEKAMRLKLETQGLAGADVHTSIDTVARQVQSQHPDLRAAAADDGTVTIMFSDIAGSTARAEALGDERWLALIRGHNAIVREHVQSCGGREVANRGDGFMVVFASPSAAVDCAIAIQKAFATPPPAEMLTTDQPIQVHIGLHTGRPAQDEGNFYGTDVNLAARIADHVAQAGQIMVSQRLHDALAAEPALTFGDPVEVALKGLTGTHQVYEVRWE